MCTPVGSAGRHWCPTDHFAQSFSFFLSVCKKKKNRPVSRADQCWHLHHTPRWRQKCCISPFRSVPPSFYSRRDRLDPFKTSFKDVRCIRISSDGLLSLSLALVGSSYVRPPLLRTTSPGPAQAYLVILWPLSLFGWWTDWLLLKTAAGADQISQHFVHRGLMKDGGVTNPSSACYDTPEVKVCLSGWWSHCLSFRRTSVATSDNTSQSPSSCVSSYNV